MDNTPHARLTLDDTSPTLLDGAKLYGADDETIGTVAHVHGSGSTASLAVDAGGFLGIGAKRVLIGASQISLRRDNHGTVYGLTSLTKDQLQALPEHADEV